MKTDNTILCVVDPLVDFMYEGRPLYVPDAEYILPYMKKVISYFGSHKKVPVVYFLDSHPENSDEISKNPDWVNTFPPHCMTGTQGAEIVSELDRPSNPLIIPHLESVETVVDVDNLSDVIILKDHNCAFEGNPNTESFVGNIKSQGIDTVYIVGVATEFCVARAVEGFASRGFKVKVVEDGVKGLGNVDNLLDGWRRGELNNVEVVKL